MVEIVNISPKARNLKALRSLLPATKGFVRFHADIAGEALAMAVVGSTPNRFLLVVTLDSWVLTGAHDSKEVTVHQLDSMVVVRCYENATMALWSQIDQDILDGKISWELRK